MARRLRGHVADLQRSIDDVVHEARRAVRDELPATTEVAPVVAARVAFWLPLAEDQGRRLDLVVEVRTPGGSPLVGLADDDLGELVDTLLDNVFAHTPDGTDARVVVRTRPDEVVVVVEDAGPGMPQPYLGRGHSAGGSTGLGLAIVHRIADGAGGSVELAPSALGGLCVTVHLPVHRDGRTTLPGPTRTADRRHGIRRRDGIRRGPDDIRRGPDDDSVVVRLVVLVLVLVLVLGVLIVLLLVVVVVGRGSRGGRGAGCGAGCGGRRTATGGRSGDGDDRARLRGDADALLQHRGLLAVEKLGDGRGRHRREGRAAGAATCPRSSGPAATKMPTAVATPMSEPVVTARMRDTGTSGAREQGQGVTARLQRRGGTTAPMVAQARSSRRCFHLKSKLRRPLVLNLSLTGR